ncbi:GNAT family N-acetyltransferase [Nitrosomonas sp. GH22]|uniref:GNAT family N-acetyltransferase n=1 Tax=Nitrosomonas sp. GH22 TaxID=153947 RepID=UPI0013711EF2|nr:GNAT family N-acetyltransferase [Nitrosomonas sp. GH22]MXS79220.1 GNAT family N-acetyltransferase [Nitrosomonas sp. GH22]
MNAWRERLALLRYKGGFKAAAFWLIKILCRVEIYFFYATDLTRQQASLPQPLVKKSGTETFHFISLNSTQDIAMHPHELIEQISSQSGRGVTQLIQDDASIYALIDGTQVVSQTNISHSTVIRVDSPTDLDIGLASGDVFLGYLFTRPHYRGLGAAALLLEMMCEDIKKHGYSRIVTHIRSTNVASLNTFKKCGWFKIGWIVVSTSNHLLLRCLRKAGITVSVVK